MVLKSTISQHVHGQEHMSHLKGAGKERLLEVVHSQPTALTTRALEYRSRTMWHAFGTLELLHARVTHYI